MSTRQEHVVTFYSPGTFFDEFSTRTIRGWHTFEAVELAKEITERYGAKPFGFEFSTRIVADPIDDGRGGSLNVESREVERSPLHFLGGEVMDYDQVHAIKDSSSMGGAASVEILLSNMRGNGWPFVLVNTNSYRTVRPFRETDLVVDPHGVVVRRGDDPDLVKKRREYVERWNTEE